MIKSSKKNVLVTDSSKFGRVSFAKFCDLNAFDIIITDTNIDKRLLERLKAIEVTVKLV